MTTYFMLKKTFSEKVAHGNQPYVWKPKKIQISTIPTTKTGWNNLIQRIRRKHGTGTYRIMRSQFPRETNGWKPVIYFSIDAPQRYTIIKRYTQYKANPDKNNQPFFKQHIKHHKIMRPPKICNRITL